MARWRRAALLVSYTLAICLSLVASPADLASDEATPASELVALPLNAGVAEFDLATGGPHAQFLIIVSSLARDNGPFHVEVRSEPIDDPRPLRAEPYVPDSAWLKQLQQRRQQLAAARQEAQPPNESKDRPRPPSEKSFWLMVRGNDFLDAKNYAAVRGQLVRVGRHCAVYLDADCRLDDEKSRLVDEAVNTFDRDVYPNAIDKLGCHRDVDGDGRFAILFTPWLGRLAGGTTSVGGFVRGSDFFDKLEPPLSNRCDMMYMNSNLSPGPHLRTLVAHEYTHAITLSERAFGRYLPDSAGNEEENWLDEAIAHLAENLHSDSWSNLDYRISAFLNAPESYRLVVDDYFAADLWRGHGNRGSTYLFLRWCVDRFGVDLLRELVQTNLCGVENVEASTGRPFAELFRAWSAAVFLSQSGLATTPDDEFRHLSLRSTLGGRLLAGPRHDSLDLSGDARSFHVAGTSTKYLIAHSPAGAGTRVRVSASPAAELQVSVRHLPDSLPRLELRTTRAAPSSVDDVPCVQVHVTEHNGAAVTLTHLAWERILNGSNRETHRGAGHQLIAAGELEELFGSAVVPAGGSLTCPLLKLTAASLADERLVLKLAGRDDAGRAVSAWCTLELRPAVLAERPDAKR